MEATVVKDTLHSPSSCSDSVQLVQLRRELEEMISSSHCISTSLLMSIIMFYRRGVVWKPQ